MNKLELLLEKVKNRDAKKALPEPSKPERKEAPAAHQTALKNDAVATPKAVEQLKRESEPEFKIRHIQCPEEAREVVQTEFDNAQIIGIDIETVKRPQFVAHRDAGLDPHLSQIRLVQICAHPDIVYVIDIFKTGLDPIIPVFDKPLVAHNAIFEMAHLYHAGVQVPGMGCTLLMHNALCGGQISLKQIVFGILAMDISKDEQCSDWSLPQLSQSQIHYAAKDAWLVRKIAPILLEKLQEKERSQVYELLQEAQFPVMKMQYVGCHFDAAAHWQLTDGIKRDLQAAESRLRQAVGPEVSPSSNKQLSDHYKRSLSPQLLNKWKKTKKGDDLCLNKFEVQKFGAIEAVQPLAAYKKLSTLVQTFGDNLVGHINPVTGRIHPNYTIAGAVTGRFTCSRPNLQQIPKDKRYRNLFNAPAGRKIVVADYSQVELRILAMLARDPVMLEAYANGQDLHRLTASSMAGVPLEQVSDEQRSAAKSVNFGITYGMGPAALCTSARNTYKVAMTQRQAKENIKAFYNKYPAIKRWGERSYQNAALYGLVKTRLGRVIKMKNAYTESRNYPVQGSAGEVMLAALVELDNEITSSGLDINLVNIIHDEIVLEVAAEEAEQANTLLEKAMVNGMLRIFSEAQTAGLVEAAIGGSWGEAK